MSKALGAMVVVFSLGGLSMTLLSGVLGGFAECAALGLVGAGLTGASWWLGGKMKQPEVTAETPRAARATS
jgi:hypothetical protein